jgi:hypothetical protein
MQRRTMALECGRIFPKSLLEFNDGLFRNRGDRHRGPTLSDARILAIRRSVEALPGSPAPSSRTQDLFIAGQHN